MIKKRFLAVLLMVVFVLSTYTSVLAATSYDGSSMPQIWVDGTGNVNMPNITKITDGAAGKASDDSYYYVDASCNSINTGFYGYGGNTLECQFMLKDESSAIILKANLYFANNKTSGNASAYNKLIVDSAGVRYYGGRWSDGLNSLKWNIPYDIVPGRWYTFVAEYEDKSAIEGQQNGKFYINGELIKEDTSLGTYGFRNFAMGPVDGAHGVYLDNIVCSNSRGASTTETHVLNVEKSKVSYITGISNGAVVSEELGDVMAIPGMTVGDIKAGLTTTDGADDIVTIYNQDLTTVADNNDEAIGKVIVIASKNGTSAEQAYNYYDITELDLDKEHGRGKNASDLVSYNTSTTVTSVAGNYGKLTSDDVYKVVSTSSEQINIPKTFTDAATLGDYGVLEFQFALEPGAYVTLVLNGDAEGYQYGKEKSINLYENTVSTGAKGTSNESINKAHIKNNKWYSAVITVPTKQNANDNLIKVYLNGEMVLEINETEMKSFRRPTLNIYNGYLDNISVSEGSAYNPLVDTPAYITNIADGAVMSEDSKSVKVLSNLTVADIKARISTTDGDDIVRIYNKDLTTVADDDDNAVGKVIVVASKNGTFVEQAYTYYPIVSDKYTVEINILRDGAPAADFYDNNSTLSFGATFTNYDGREYNPTLYVALYKDGTLEKLWTDTATLTQAGTTANLSVDVSDMPSERIGTSIKTMLVEGETLTPYSVAKKLRFGYADTPATLYIIGDSIAQSYEINAPGETTHSKSPFIQGWGYHIVSYLNDSITVDNRARSGWDTDRFLYPDGIYTKEDGVDSAGIKLNDKDGNQKVVSASERYKCWPSIKEDIKEGDYLMIALGINDAGSANVPDDRFEENLTVLCREAQSKGATVIFSTPTINGGKWTDEWSFKEESSYRGSIMAKVASDNGAYCLPTGATLATLYNSIYAEYAAANPGASTLQKKQYVRSQFHRYDAVFNAPVSEGGYGYTGISGLNDQQHYADRGAKRVAEIIATLISQTDCILADYLINLPDEL